MDLHDMHYLIALHKYGNIGKAADEVHVSQPALSKFLQQQNQYYGEKLFTKQGHKLQITEFGEMLLKYAMQFTILEETMNHEISCWQSKNKPFKIALPGGSGRHVLSIAFPKFMAAYPDVDLRYIDIHTTLAYDKIRSGEVDAAVCGIPVDDADFSWKSIYREEMVLAISKNHPIVKEGVTRSGFSHPWIDLHHLKEETFILLAKTQWPGAATETIFKQINFTPQKITRITDIQTAAQLTSVGVGATILIDKYHTFMVNPEQISILSCGEEPVYHHSGIVWKKDRILPSYCGDLFREIELSFKHIAGET